MEVPDFKGARVFFSFISYSFFVLVLLHMLRSTEKRTATARSENALIQRYKNHQIISVLA